MTAAKIVAALLIAASAYAQAPKQLLEALPPTRPPVTIEYTNPFDGSKNEALVDLPEKLRGPAPLIVTPHGANWTQEMNRSLWSGVADRFGVIVLYPRHQGKINPRVSFGSRKQLLNLMAAIAEAKKRYPVDASKIYAGGISQGGVETLLLVGEHPEQFAGAIAINPIADMLAFYEDVAPDKIEATTDPPLRKLRQQQWPALRNVMVADFGGTPETARPEYYRRSGLIFARQLASVPLLLYWAENDELIPNGATRQSGMLAGLIRTFNPAAFQEVKHSGGHGYPFYQVDLSVLSVKVFPRDIFLAGITQMLDPKHAARQ